LFVTRAVMCKNVFVCMHWRCVVDSGHTLPTRSSIHSQKMTIRISLSCSGILSTMRWVSA